MRSGEEGRARRAGPSEAQHGSKEQSSCVSAGRPAQPSPARRHGLVPAREVEVANVYELCGSN